MSYFCYLHNWTHAFQACPQCSTVVTRTTTTLMPDPALEHSAYDKLLRENEKLKFELSELTNGRTHTCWDECPRVECRLQRENESLRAENDKLIRLLNGETVEMECKYPGLEAVVQFIDDLGAAWDERKKK